VLVEATGDEDAHLGEPGAVEQLAGLEGQLRQVAAVEADPRMVLEAEPVDHLDGAGDAAERVVGVDQERRAGGEVLGERDERLALGGERLHVGVRHRPGRGQPEPAGGLDVAGGGEPDHRREAGCGEPGFDPVGAAEAEVDQLDPPGGGDAAPGRLRRERRLEAHLVEEVGLHQLRLGDRGGDLEDRLVGEHGRWRTKGLNVAGAVIRRRR
jgi:hypothetical protein